MGLKEALTALGEAPYQHTTVTLRDCAELIAENWRRGDKLHRQPGGLRRDRAENSLRRRGTPDEGSGHRADPREPGGAYGVRVTGSIEAVSFLSL